MVAKIIGILLSLGAAILATWATSYFTVPAPYDALAIQLFGSLFVAVLTWSLVSVPRRKQLFLETKRNHIELLGFWRLGPNPTLKSTDLLEQRRACAFYDTMDSQRDLFVELKSLGVSNNTIDGYSRALDDLTQAQKCVENKEPGYVNWSSTYVAPWNKCHEAFRLLARSISLTGYLRVWRDRKLFVLNDAKTGRKNRLPARSFWSALKEESRAD